MKYCLVSLGCQMNTSDAERVSSVLESLGFERTESEEDAAILGLVACSVRQRAIDRAYAKIRKWNSWKNERSLLTFATGCVLPADKNRLLKTFDFFFPITDLPDLPDMISRYGVVTQAGIAFNIGAAVPPESHADERKGFWQIDPAYASSFEAYVPIQNGCDKFCTYCAVPYTRGREVSRPSDEILAEVDGLIQRGYKSITLLGQNVNSYGRDRQGSEIGFASLLEQIGKMGKSSGNEQWVYFTSPHPRDMTRDVIEVISTYSNLGKQIHLPLQSGDDEVLTRMNRNHGLEEYRRSVDQIRTLIPGATLFTDIIVGFPGETEEQFEHTRRAMREFNYNMAYIAMYSPRPGAKSAKWQDDIPHEEKNRRLHELSAELKSMSRTHNNALIGKTMRVLISGHDRKAGYLSGKTEGRIIARFPSIDDTLIGHFADVKISLAADMSVEGDLVTAT
jgi:tRNA-2-methylthio-N6-dimethylallyladenosine synthase